ncbi:hypothetical protein GALMADRAFT_926954 [Galerina marginata CBS 339.88]|uniref:F-box domain-containing protein n=1 Tax=Galerina marginata (strain CBS 339.88) TaxID=685588 RepID=A0A067SR60_GALM3|nr:hypothetical protein GALMADRAFT_926954 [Galerina marginata CBS 339.88]
MDHLPPELQDEILRNLRQDKKALAACSATCRSLLPICQRHIFEYLIIGCSRIRRRLQSNSVLALPQFLQALEDYPYVGSYVRYLEIDEEYSDPTVLGEIPLEVVKCCPNLKYLSIQADLNEDFSLNLSPKSCVPVSTSVSPQSLRINILNYRHRLRNGRTWLKACAKNGIDLTRLKTLHAEVYRFVGDHAFFGDIMRYCASSLEEFTLCPGSKVAAREGVEPSVPIDLSILSNLRIFSIRLRVIYDFNRLMWLDSTPWFLRLFKTLLKRLPNPLEELNICINHQSSGSLQNHLWFEVLVDLLMDKKKFPLFRRFAILIGSFDDENAQKAIESMKYHFRKINMRGVEIDFATHIGDADYNLRAFTPDPLWPIETCFS